MPWEGQVLSSTAQVLFVAGGRPLRFTSGMGGAGPDTNVCSQVGRTEPAGWPLVCLEWKTMRAGL